MNKENQTTTHDLLEGMDQVATEVNEVVDGMDAQIGAEAMMQGSGIQDDGAVLSAVDDKAFDSLEGSTVETGIIADRGLDEIFDETALQLEVNHESSSSTDEGGAGQDEVAGEVVAPNPLDDEEFFEVDAEAIAAINGVPSSAGGVNHHEGLSPSEMRKKLLASGSQDFLVAGTGHAMPADSIDFGGEHHPEGQSMRSFSRGAEPAETYNGGVPGVVAHPGTPPQYSAAAHLAGAITGGLVGAARGVFNALATKPAAAAVRQCQNYMESRDEKAFLQHMREAEAIAAKWKELGGDKLSADTPAVDVIGADALAEMVTKLKKVAQDLEQSSGQFAATAIKNGMPSDEVLERTARKVAKFAEENEQMLTSLSDDKETLLDRFDRITTDLVTLIKTAMQQIASWVSPNQGDEHKSAQQAPKMG